MKMKSFFIHSKLLAEVVHRQKSEEEELNHMREELQRKDNLIREHVKKLSRYRVVDRGLAGGAGSSAIQELLRSG